MTPPFEPQTEKVKPIYWVILGYFLAALAAFVAVVATLRNQWSPILAGSVFGLVTAALALIRPEVVEKALPGFMK